ncbi:VUT family protein [uncultured Fibrobacter sp.]
MPVHAFGFDTTLGNVLFASTFLATDMMSELYGKREASRCVKIGFPHW